ncbi:EpsG family protein [Robiginitalea sp. M366]|uniref:EpsG family protein n=1 Tax=Robiginitalea aestuariiviva TaxID=3036903 RepID=UPI00240D5D27|nr:EpsG family protein [Robiginitalea aestuariiviva]MDG1572733.1 EpsG family protein [Robiginitalea aestuariiviva]
MFDFISLEAYYPIYINLCLFLVLFSYFHTLVIPASDQRNLIFINTSGYLLLVFLIFYIGQRPISGVYFGDTINYYRAYLNFQHGTYPDKLPDMGWYYLMKFFSKYFGFNTFLTFCSTLYIVPMFFISKKLFQKFWFYAFIMFVVSFSFWTYGVNGVRNGVATSLFLLGVCFRKHILINTLLFLIAISIHKTLLLPCLAYAVTFIFNKPSIYFKGWLIAIPLSLIAGGFWIAFFSGLGFADDRASTYLLEDGLEGTSSNIGFRWDFLFHSAFAVFAGWFFVIKKKFKDPFYNRLLNTYLICNAFWILVIQANYSNRFAYLSWFMMAIIIIYPILKGSFFKNQGLIMSNIIAAYFAFTYLMYYIYYAG